MEFTSEVRAPRERVAVLIGKKGVTRKQLERKLDIGLAITSEGDITIKSDDGLKVYIAENVIKAIARGFTPEEALKLCNENMAIEFISIKDYTGSSENKFARMSARIIGTQGKTRKFLEHMTKTTIVIYGKTVGILGPVENVVVARQAIEKLLQGAPHGNAYKLVESRMARAYHE